MPIESVTTTPAAAATPPTVQESAPSATLDKDAFLTLLVAQLKYQDPTAPTDVSEMMAQTSQLSMVERLDQIAAGIDLLGGGAPLSSAASMLGREITFDVGGLTPVTAIVDAVRLIDGVTVLSAGGYDVPLGALLEVSDVTATSETPAADATDATDTTEDAGDADEAGEADTDADVEADADAGIEATDGVSGDADELSDDVPSGPAADDLDDGLGIADAD